MISKASGRGAIFRFVLYSLAKTDNEVVVRLDNSAVHAAATPAITCTVTFVNHTNERVLAERRARRFRLT